MTMFQLTNQDVEQYLARDLFAQALLIVEHLSIAQKTLAFAESITGGLMADAIVSVPGASKVFRGSAVTYATNTKSSVLDVETHLLEKFGAVHHLVAESMAVSSLRVFEADVAMSSTGVAGPNKQDGMPIGRVYVGLSTSSTTTSYEISLNPILEALDPNSFDATSDTRSRIRHATVHIACGVLLDFLDSR